MQKFFADRGTHLAAMIAYFALLAFVPLTFLALALLGLTGRADESSFLVKEIKHALPGTPIVRIVDLVHTVQDNAAALGMIGTAGFVLLLGCLLVGSGTRIAATTAPDPTVGLVFYDLKSCLRSLDEDEKPKRTRKKKEEA